MALQYRTREGDTVDLIAWRQYGRQDRQVVETLLEANPTLADFGPVIPPGTEVMLPEILVAAEVNGVRLWD